MFSIFKKIFLKKPKKLGLALGSGGAKGMALVGVLKAFEENNIKFDMVGGTSIGSIVGGFLAGGHTTSEMFDFLKQFDITNPTTLIMMKLKGISVETFLDNILGGSHIEDLILPYFAVACDINTGEEIIMDKGNLANAMAASSAIPPAFRPVARDNRKLIDGAYLNSVPADILKERGADVVISVSLTERSDKLSSTSVLDKLYPGHKVKSTDRLTRGLIASNLVIEPNLKAYSTTSIDKLYEMYQEGYRSAIEAMPKILGLLKKHKIKV